MAGGHRSLGERGDAGARPPCLSASWSRGCWRCLAESYLGAGDAELARARAEEALALAQQRETLTQEIDAQLAVARVRRRAEGLSARPAIEAALERALALVRETGARGFEPHVYLERAELARLSGDETTRQRELREAHRLFLEIGATDPCRGGREGARLGDRLVKCFKHPPSRRDIG